MRCNRFLPSTIGICVEVNARLSKKNILDSFIPLPDADKRFLLDVCTRKIQDDLTVSFQSEYLIQLIGKNRKVASQTIHTKKQLPIPSASTTSSIRLRILVRAAFTVSL